MTILSTQAPGKLMLAGEYAVLFGYPAIVAAINQQAIVRFIEGKNFVFTSETYTKTVNAKDPLFLSVLKSCKDKGLEAKPGTYTLDTKSFFDIDSGQKLGLGSSAAASVALCKMIFLQHLIDDQNLLFDIAFNAHKIFSNGLGSGADVAAAVYGGVISYQSGQMPVSITNNNILLDNLIFIDTKIPQSTRDFIQKAQRWASSNNQALIDFCLNSSQLCEDLLRTKDISSLILVFDALFDHLYHFAKQTGINVISAEHAQIHQIAKDFEGSAKPSGAGGGDISLAVVPKSNRHHFINKIRHCGFLDLPISIL